MDPETASVNTLVVELVINKDEAKATNSSTKIDYDLEFAASTIVEYGKSEFSHTQTVASKESLPVSNLLA